MSNPNTERDERVDPIREAASLIRIWMYRNDFDAERCAKEVFDLFRQQCSERFFWVLERFEDGQSAGYWNGVNSRSFVTNIDAAIQFRRMEDALPIKSSWHWQDVKITEHGYVAPLDGQATTNDAATRICVEKVREATPAIVACRPHSQIADLMSRLIVELEQERL